MKVKVKLFASLRTFGPDDQVLEVPAETTIDDVVHILRIPGTIRLLRIVNGEHRPADHRLQDNDELALFPPLAGGQLPRSIIDRAAGGATPASRQVGRIR